MLVNPLDYSLFDLRYATYIDGIAGANLSFAPPVLASTEFGFIQVQLDTDANAVDRTLRLIVIHDGVTLDIAVAQVDQPANTSYFYHFAPGISAYTADSGTRIFTPLPWRFRVRASALFTLGVVNIQVGDQLTNLRTAQHIWQGTV